MVNVVNMVNAVNAVNAVNVVNVVNVINVVNVRHLGVLAGGERRRYVVAVSLDPASRGGSRFVHQKLRAALGATKHPFNALLRLEVRRPAQGIPPP